MFSKSNISLVAASLALAGCNTTYQNIGSPDPGFGEVTKHNAAVQIIDPDPVYTAESSQPGDHGAKGTAATRRYRTDAVKALEEQGTTSGGGGSR